MFLRFTSVRPSLLEVDDRTRDHESRVATLAKEFRPRPKDDGKLSMWKAEGARDEARHVVVHATRSSRSRLDDVQYARIAVSWLDSLGLLVSPSRAEDAFECVADLHWELNAGDLALMLNLADRVLREQEGAVGSGAPAPLVRVHRSDPSVSAPTVSEMIEIVYGCCSTPGPPPDLSGVATWAKDLVQRTERGRPVATSGKSS